MAVNADDHYGIQSIMREGFAFFEFRPAVKYPVVDFDLVSNATILQNDGITRTMAISVAFANFARNYGQIPMLPPLINPKAGDSCVIRVRGDKTTNDR